MAWRFLGKYRDEGLLLLRLGIGFMFIMHGGFKLLDGPDRWESLGHAMRHFGVRQWPLLWGLLASLAEFLGGICFILGALFRPASLLLLIVMIVAATVQYHKGGLMVAAHPIEMGILFAGLLFIGPGRYSVDRG